MSRIAVTPMLVNATGNGDSAIIQPAATPWSIHVFGTKGSATITVNVSSDGVNWIAAGTVASLPSVFTYMVNNHWVPVKYVKVTISGASGTTVSANIQQEVLA